jgi:hypothetical protein
VDWGGGSLRSGEKFGRIDRFDGSEERTAQETLLGHGDVETVAWEAGGRGKDTVSLIEPNLVFEGGADPTRKGAERREKQMISRRRSVLVQLPMQSTQIGRQDGFDLLCGENLPFQLSAILDCAGQQLSLAIGFIIGVCKVSWKLTGLQSVARLAVTISSVSSIVAVTNL